MDLKQMIESEIEEIRWAWTSSGQTGWNVQPYFLGNDDGLPTVESLVSEVEGLTEEQRDELRLAVYSVALCWLDENPDFENFELEQTVAEKLTEIKRGDKAVETTQEIMNAIEDFAFSRGRQGVTVQDAYEELVRQGFEISLEQTNRIVRRMMGLD
jgi:hypothetical protein